MRVVALSVLVIWGVWLIKVKSVRHSLHKQPSDSQHLTKKKEKFRWCCDMEQSDTIGKIELIHLSILSTRVTNWKNDIHKFL